MDLILNELRNLGYNTEQLVCDDIDILSKYLCQIEDSINEKISHSENNLDK